MLDCIHCHPNYINALFDVIKDVSLDERLNNLAEFILFKPYIHVEHSKLLDIIV